MNMQKPIPLKTLDNHPYWDAADRHELVLQKCDQCQHYAHPPGPACPTCGSEELSWEKLGSDINGTVYSYIVSYRPFLPGFQDQLPLVIAIVELEKVPEVRLIGNILECPPDDVQIGMKVKMMWEEAAKERAIPQWVKA